MYINDFSRSDTRAKNFKPKQADSKIIARKILSPQEYSHESCNLQDPCLSRKLKNKASYSSRLNASHKFKRCIRTASGSQSVRTKTMYNFLLNHKIQKKLDSLKEKMKSNQPKKVRFNI
ncbi:unnamed protein product [Moneuplotes crassus]|uniref:Uncharacterized protein n=1 Tax=Euplotes crassus TaxID=5936 RepID=A0AAD2D2N5_EUPCR|nr:unnamed protein product [Moneuplotes crassus]